MRINKIKKFELQDLNLSKKASEIYSNSDYTVYRIVDLWDFGIWYRYAIYINNEFVTVAVDLDGVNYFFENEKGVIKNENNKIKRNWRGSFLIEK